MRTFYLVVTVLGFLLLQAVVAPRLAIGRVQPDFVVLIIVFLALMRGPVVGSIAGFIIGFSQDLGNADLLGINALVGSVAGFAVGQVGARTFPDNLIFKLGLFFFVAWMKDGLYLLVYHWPRIGTSLGETFAVALPSAVFTAVAGVVADRVIARIGSERMGGGKAG